MLWQRKNSVFNGEFACCRLGHKSTGADGTVRELQCDKARIRPLVKGLWERKNAHLKKMHPMIRFFFQWRWATHQYLMMAEEVDDSGEADDPAMQTLDDYKKRYVLDTEFFDVFKSLIGMVRRRGRGSRSQGLRLAPARSLSLFRQGCLLLWGGGLFMPLSVCWKSHLGSPPCCPLVSSLALSHPPLLLLDCRRLLPWS